MTSTHRIALGLSILIVAIVAADASAYYHPGLGRFVSRDPGPGSTIARIGTAGPAGSGHTITRDPTGSGQYIDGANLYQYVRSMPTVLVDPMGLSTDCYYYHRGHHGGDHIQRVTKNGHVVGRYTVPGLEPIRHGGNEPPPIPHSDLVRVLRLLPQQ
jgi:uncharacterized protein RhaS with RHS repeats